MRDVRQVDAVVTDPPYGTGAYATDRAVSPDVYAELVAQ